MAKEMHLKVGDALDFDVQGVPFATTVGSIRKVDWSRFEPNFFVVFPVGVLEAAPTFNVLVTRAAERGRFPARAQADVVRQFPTVSAIDLSLIVATIKGIVDKATTAVRLLSLFTVGTGLLVLAAAIITGRYERVKEGVLLRTLGRVAAADFPHPDGGIFLPGQPFGVDGHRAGGGGQLGVGDVGVQAAVGAVAGGDGGVLVHRGGVDGGHRAAGQPGRVRPSAAGDFARGGVKFTRETQRKRSEGKNRAVPLCSLRSLRLSECGCA